MDWGRAKTILICTFLLLNILLGYQLFIQNIEFPGSYFGMSALREDMNKVLESKNIQLEHDIRSEPSHLRVTLELPPLPSEVTDPSYQTLEEPFDVSLLGRNRISSDISSQIEDFNEYAYDAASSTESERVYYQLYEEKWPMFEVNLRLYVEDRKVVGYTQHKVEVIPDINSEEQEMLSVYRVITFLAEHVLPRDTVIKDVQLGFHGQVFDSNTRVLAPKWRVVTSQGDVYYVHGVNGAIEKKESNET